MAAPLAKNANHFQQHLYWDGAHDLIRNQFGAIPQSLNPKLQHIQMVRIQGAANFKTPRQLAHHQSPGFICAFATHTARPGIGEGFKGYLSSINNIFIRV